MNRSILESAICSLIGNLGTTLNGNIQLASWADQSGSGNDAVQFEEQSAYVDPEPLNGKAVIRFGGAMSLPLTSSPEYTVFALLNVHPKYTSAFLGTDGAQPNVRWALAVGSDPSEGFGWGGNGNVGLGHSDAVPANEWKLLTYVRKVGSWDIYCNSVFIRTVTDVTALTYLGSHAWCLGRESKGTGMYNFSGKIAELLILEEAAKNGQRKKIEKEILTYWGL
jgi:hypothetical protein